MEPIDIVIPTRNRGTRVQTVIQSICQNTHHRFQLWVIDQSDDNSTEETVNALAATDARIHYQRSSSRGANFARNEGAMLGTATIICFVDDDCRVEATWLEEIAHEFAKDEQTGLVFGRVLPDDEYKPALTAEQRPVSKSIPAALKDSPTRRVYRKKRFDLSFGHGANMAFRRSTYLNVAGFDGYIGAGGPLGTWDERDIGYRVLCRPDGQIVYSPKPLVYHQHWRDWSAVKSAYRKYAIGTGAAVSKYLRCGDLGSLYFLLEWVLDQGVRQVLSGLFKWRSWQKIHIGCLQIVCPWIGLFRGLRFPVNRQRVLYSAATQAPHQRKPVSVRLDSREPS